MSITLNIVQPKILKDGYEILDGNKKVGSLTCGGYFKSKAEARAAGKRWQFVQSGVFRQKITVTDLAGDKLLATFAANTFKTGGNVELDGQQFTFAKTSVWKQHYAWKDSEGREIISYEIGGILKMVGQITASDNFTTDPQLLLLALLGIYKLKLDIDMTSASAAASIAATTAATS